MKVGQLRVHGFDDFSSFFVHLWKHYLMLGCGYLKRTFQFLNCNIRIGFKSSLERFGFSLEPFAKTRLQQPRTRQANNCGPPDPHYCRARDT